MAALDGGGGGGSWQPIVGDASLAALSKMMIEKARGAVWESDYVNALEYMLAVSGVEQHRDITTALAVTVLDVVDALELAPDALIAKADLLRSIVRNGTDKMYNGVRECFSGEVCLHILEKARKFSDGQVREFGRADNVSLLLIQNVNKLTYAESERPTTSRRDFTENQPRNSAALGPEEASAVAALRLAVQDGREELVALGNQLREMQKVSLQQLSEVRKEHKRLIDHVSMTEHEFSYRIERRWWVARKLTVLTWVIVVSGIASLVTSYASAQLPLILESFKRIIALIAS